MSMLRSFQPSVESQIQRHCCNLSHYRVTGDIKVWVTNSDIHLSALLCRLMATAIIENVLIFTQRKRGRIMYLKKKLPKPLTPFMKGKGCTTFKAILNTVKLSWKKQSESFFLNKEETIQNEEQKTKMVFMSGDDFLTDLPQKQTNLMKSY